MAFFRREPKDLEQRALEAQEREAEDRARQAQDREEVLDKYARRGLQRAAEVVGVQNVRDIEAPDRITSSHGRLHVPRVAIEGEILVNGEPATVVMASSATVDSRLSFGGRQDEDRYATVHVIKDGQTLASVNYKWDTYYIGRNPVETKYELGEGSSPVSEGQLLAHLQDGLSTKVEVPEVEQGPRPVLSSMVASAAPSAGADRAPEHGPER